MTEINFQPVFDYIDQAKLDVLSEVKDILSAKVEPLRTDVANLAGQVKDFHHEMGAMGFRVDRLEKWAKPAGEKLGYPLNL